MTLLLFGRKILSIKSSLLFGSLKIPCIPEVLYKAVFSDSTLSLFLYLLLFQSKKVAFFPLFLQLCFAGKSKGERASILFQKIVEWRALIACQGDGMIVILILQCNYVTVQIRALTTFNVRIQNFKISHVVPF